MNTKVLVINKMNAHGWLNLFIGHGLVLFEIFNIKKEIEKPHIF